MAEREAKLQAQQPSKSSKGSLADAFGNAARSSNDPGSKRPSAPAAPNNPDVEKVHEKAQAEDASRHNRTLAQKDTFDEDRGILSLKGGMRGSADLAGRTDSAEAAQKKEKEEAAYYKAIKDGVKALEERLAALEEMIAEIDERLDEIKIELEEIEELENLIKSGEIDPNNPEHKRLMEKYKVTEDDLASGYWFQILNGARDDLYEEQMKLNKEREKLVAEKEDVKSKVEQARALNAIEDPEKREEAAKKFVEENGQTEEDKDALNKTAIELTEDSQKIEITTAKNYDAQDEALEISGALEREAAMETSFNGGFDLSSPIQNGSNKSLASTLGEPAFDVKPLAPQFDAAANPGKAAPAVENEQAPLLARAAVQVPGLS